ncbi:MAG: hypothetical protein ACTJG2_01570 [Candidatus Saccharimonadales bacterium]
MTRFNAKKLQKLIADAGIDEESAEQIVAANEGRKVNAERTSGAPANRPVTSRWG